MEKSNGTSRTARDYLYLLAFLSLSLGLNAYELIASPPPAINFWEGVFSIAAGAAVIIFVFITAERITGSVKAGLFSAALMVPIQIYTWKTTAQLTHTMGVLLFIASLYFFSRVKDFDWRLALIVPVVFAFIHFYSLLLIPAYLIYIGLIKLKHKEVGQDELKFIMASTACILGVFLLFKITPAAIFLFGKYTNYFTISSAPKVYKSVLAFAGSLPIYIGLYGAYAGITKDKKAALLFVSAAIAIFLGFITQLVNLQLGLPYLATAFVCLAGFAFYELEKYVLNSKFKHMTEQAFIATIIVVLALGVLHRVVFTFS
ncbi:MAG: hypothetical protein HYT16_03555 [DPANN group archaeon]|nr:hypothetical protein [DPANN group archaeon]